MSLTAGELPHALTNAAVKAVSDGAARNYAPTIPDAHQEMVRAGAAAPFPLTDPLIPILADMVRLIVNAERFMTGATTDHQGRNSDDDSVETDM